MQIIKTINELKKQLLNKYSIGFVPTMGALHQGHISLINQARKENDIVVVSIFVNPTQFLANEDLNKYPKNHQKDIDKCKKEKVNFLFMPNINMMYSENEISLKAPNISSYILEGQRRPSHFDGVLQIVLKLFNIVKPTNAYFGKKDAQQLLLIKQMVDNLFLDINIKECDIVREEDGLAMSSRNIYLSKEERKLSLNISKALFLAQDIIQIKKILNSNDIIKSMKNILNNLDIEYIKIVNRDFKLLEKVEINNTIILVAVKIHNTRLIDNIWI